MTDSDNGDSLAVAPAVVNAVDLQQHSTSCALTLPPITTTTTTTTDGSNIRTTSIASHYPISPLKSSPKSMMPADIVDRLRELSLFKSAPQSFLEELTSKLTIQHISPMQFITIEGEDPSAIYWLVKGTVNIVSKDGECTYAEMSPGSYFGEIGVVFDMPRAATVMARTKCLVIQLSKSHLKGVLPDYPLVDKELRSKAQKRLENLRRLRQEVYKQHDDHDMGTAAAVAAAAAAAAVRRKLPMLDDDDVDSISSNPGSPAPSITSAPNDTESSLSPSGSSVGTTETSLTEASVEPEDEQCVPTREEQMLEKIERIPMLALLPTTERLALINKVEVQNFERFDYVFRQGEMDMSVFFLSDGLVEVIEERSENVRAILSKGAMFGEFAFLGLSPCRTASIRTATYAECLVISPEVMADLCRKFVDLQAALEELATARQTRNHVHGYPKDQDPYSVYSEPENHHHHPSRDKKKQYLHRHDHSPLDFDIGQYHSLNPSTALGPLLANRSQSLPPSEPQPRLSADKGGSELTTTRQNDTTTEVAPSTLHQSPKPSALLLSDSSRPPTPTVHPKKLTSPLGGRSPSINTTRRSPPKVVRAALESTSSSSDEEEFTNIRPYTTINTVNGQPRGVKRTLSGNPTTEYGSVAPVRPNKNEYHWQHSRPPLPLATLDASQRAAATGTRGPLYMHSQSKRYQTAGRGSIRRRTTMFNVGPFPDVIQIQIFENLDLYSMMNSRQVCAHWQDLLTKSPSLVADLDLTPFNTRINDKTIIPIVNFAGMRPRTVDISNCFHLTDEGFTYLVNGLDFASVRSFKMKSVWSVTDAAINDLVVPNMGMQLEEIDLSNCRRVNDNTVNRLLGWVVPNHQADAYPPPGTVVGCSKLKRLTLSYCKHVTDRFMYHVAMHAASRIEYLDLTRCTGITDQGFAHWSQVMMPFKSLKTLILSDCTFLTDKSIISLAGVVKDLEDLNLSFCCALTDVSVQVLALGCTRLKRLNMAYCGSAVSDRSLNMMALQLHQLESLSIRGCIRVSRSGIDSIRMGCSKLKEIDASQCRNVVGLENETNINGVMIKL